MSDPASKTLYRNVLLSLLVLTVVTVAISRVDFGGKVPNYIIGVLVAVIKATLVVLFFMHLKYEKRWWTSIVLFPLALVMIMIFSNFPDTAMNDDAIPQNFGIIKSVKKAGAH